MNLRKFISLGVIGVLFLAGCATKEDLQKDTNTTKKPNIIQQELALLDKKKKIEIKNNLPPLMLPGVYEEPTITQSTGKLITFSAIDAPLSKLLYLIANEAGLNLVVDTDVDVSKPVTLTMRDAPIQDALDITMDISNSYVQIRGNIMHVKSTMTQTFEIPFINMKASTSSSLGGDLLGSGETTSGLTGDYSIKYTSDDEGMNFYLQLENSLKNILSAQGKYSINKFSGTLVVSDSRQNILQVEKIIEKLKKFVNKQIQIEAKIMEVVLNNEHQLGVNWQNVWNVNNGQFGAQGTVNTASTAPTIGNMISPVVGPIAGSTAMTLAYTKNNFSAVLQAMQSAGSVEVVSNPRIKVINGQTGVLSSGNMVPYWEKEVTYVQNTVGTTTTTTPEITYTKMDVLNGISLGVSPIIKENGEVLLNVVPVVTSIEGEKSFIGAEGEVARAPIINVKEAGTTILTKDNDMIVIGGLISSSSKEAEYKTPMLGDIPFFGNLFKRSESEQIKRELVIILTIDVDTRE